MTTKQKITEDDDLEPEDYYPDDFYNAFDID